MAKVILAANTEWYLYNFRLSLARFLRDEGYEVVMVSPPGRYAASLRSAGFQWIEWNLGRQTLAPWTEFSSFIQLLRIYQREKPDIVHHFTVKPVLYGSLAARLTGVDGIVNAITGLGYVFLSQDTRASLIRTIVKRLYRMTLDRPNYAAIFENKTDRGYFIDQGFISPDRAWLIQGVGVDVGNFLPLPEPESLPVVLLAARMLWDKGVGDLVTAARILGPRAQVRFVLVGEPDPGNPAAIEKSEIQSWVNEGILEWWGWQKDMNSVYADSHIVTLPSLGEGIPTVLLEAAACARPIVTTDTPGCRDVVEDGVNGFLVPPNDPEALADALYQLIIDPDLRGRMGKASRQLVLSKFTSDLVNQATLDVYNNVLNPSNNRRKNCPN
jgi:glycosyltransferase involved in cell wall biosynthesis